MRERQRERQREREREGEGERGERESEREGGGTERTSLFTNLTKTCFDVYIYMIKITECTADKEYK